MIYVVYGTDTKKSVDYFNQLISSLKKKKPDVFLHKIDFENFDIEEFKYLISGQDLFSKKYIITCSGLLSDDVSYLAIKDYLKQAKESEHLCLFLEYDLDKKKIKQIEKLAEKIKNFEEKKIISRQGEYNIFSLTDALGLKDRKGFWLELQKAVQAGVLDEDIFWKLDDHVKKMILVKTTDTQGLNFHPFYLKKLKNQANNFSLDELKFLSKKLFDLYEGVRMGKREMGTGLELVAISV